MLALELEERARARGARIYATIEGYASTCDAYHRVQMDPDGEQIVRCMHEAVAKSGRVPEEIGYINYHGSSTDAERRHRIAVHAPGVWQAGGKNSRFVDQVNDWSSAGRQRRRRSGGERARALANGYLPPTINQTNPDPDCDLDFIPNVGREAQPVAALCNCLGFGSKNSALVLGRADG